MTAAKMPDLLHVFTSQQGDRVFYHGTTDPNVCGTEYARKDPTPSPVDCRDIRAEFENEFAGKISLVKSGDFPETYSENLSQMLWISWQAAWNAAKGEGK